MHSKEIITYFDWLQAISYGIVIFVIAGWLKKKYYKNDLTYQYFLPALYAKIVSAIGLALIYVYYYEEGGDTLGYHNDSSVLVKLLFHSPSDFIRVWLMPITKNTVFYFTKETGYPWYLHDPNTFMVVRLLVPIKLLCFDTYLVSSMLMAVVSFTGIWKLYRLFCDYYPALYKYFAITILFVPSVLFWGSGILKDSWTLAAVGWFCYLFYKIFIKRNKVFLSLAGLIISMLVLIQIKPYIFVGLFPGAILWMIWGRLSKIKNKIIRIIVAPLIVSAGIGLGWGIWISTSSSLGAFGSMENIVQKAYVSYDDLKKDYYKGNSFDFGNWEPTLEGMLSKFPVAITTGLFRPFLWEAKNIVMAISGLENLAILCFSIWVLFRRPFTTIKNLFSNPLILLCLIFAIFFAFSIAISTSNFGALVRLRIPMEPFWLSGMVLIEYGRRIIKVPSLAKV